MSTTGPLSNQPGLFRQSQSADLLNSFNNFSIQSPAGPSAGFPFGSVGNIPTPAESEGTAPVYTPSTPPSNPTVPSIEVTPSPRRTSKVKKGTKKMSSERASSTGARRPATRPASAFALESLQSEDRSRLFDVIDKIRELNISEDVSLPQLVVVGDQSSGKSSLLEGLTGIKFPVATELCTRFATQIVLRRTNEEEVQVRATIIPSDDNDEEIIEYLESFEIELPESSFTAERFKGILDQAALAMGINVAPSAPMQTEDDDFQKDTAEIKRFSNDILKIELSGKTLPHLTIVDIPGLFHNATSEQSDDDIVLIRELIERYIEDESTIILAVMDGRVNFANQGVFKMAREADPDGNRTVGVITKCDVVESGNEPRVLKVASNKEHVLKHGWFVVRNRTTREVEQGVSPSQRNERERSFFNTEPWNSIDKERVGVGKLLPFLGHLLYKHVKNEFPRLVDDINRMVSETSAELEAMGPARDSLSEQRRYLTRIANEYERGVVDCLESRFREEVDPDSPLKIRTLVQNMNEEFGERIKVLGHTREFSKGKEGDAIRAPRSTKYAVERAKLDRENKIPAAPVLFGTAPAPPSDIEEWIRKTYRQCRGPELPGLVNPNTVTDLFRIQTKNWGVVAKEHVANVAQAVDKFHQATFRLVITDATVRRRLTTALSKQYQDSVKGAYAQLDDLVESERKGILQTVNPAYAETLSRTRYERIADRLKNVQLTSQNSQDRATINLAAVMAAVKLSNEDSAVYDIHDILKSYYSISLTRFTDNVLQQVVEKRLLGKVYAAGPLSLLSAEYISGLDDTVLSGIASEEEEVTKRRSDLKVKLERATSAQEAASMIYV